MRVQNTSGTTGSIGMLTVAAKVPNNKQGPLETLMQSTKEFVEFKLHNSKRLDIKA